MIPGGFSYGDDVAAGKILANQMLHRLAEPLNEFLAAGKLVLGICNGFQVMIKSGLLPWGQVEPRPRARDATLAWNDCGKFEDRWVHLKADGGKCVFLPKGEIVACRSPMARASSSRATTSVLRQLQEASRWPCDTWTPPARRGEFPINPNGSVDDIAGICDPTGRVMGLMPHPERFVDITHHPQWTRKKPGRWTVASSSNARSSISPEPAIHRNCTAARAGLERLFSVESLAWRCGRRRGKEWCNMSCAAGAWDHYLQNRDRCTSRSDVVASTYGDGAGRGWPGPDRCVARRHRRTEAGGGFLLNLLVARGVLSVEEFAQQAKIIDELDGRPDGRFHGRIKANGEITPEAQDRTELDDLADAARDE